MHFFKKQDIFPTMYIEAMTGEEQDWATVLDKFE